MFITKFSYQVYEQGSDRLLAISDSSIIGKTFEDGELRLEVSEFYSGKSCGEKEAVQMLKSATIVNAVGRDIIALMLREKLISNGNILEINKMPHAQVVAIR